MLRPPLGSGQPVEGGMLEQPIGLPITGVAPTVAGTAAQPVGGFMGAYAGPSGLPYRRQASGLAVGPGGGFGYGAAGALGDAGAAGASPVAHGQAA